MASSSSGQPVVVGFDGSDLATVALAWGVDSARRRSCPLKLVHTSRPSDRPAGEEMLNDAASRAKRAVPGLDISTVLDSGDPAEALLKQASDAGVVVLGARGRSDLSSMLLGSTSLRVAMHAPCPVVVIRLAGEDAPPGPSAGRIVVGIDDSPQSEHAADFAFREAAARGRELTAVLTWLGPDIDTAASPAHEWQQASADERALLDQKLGPHREGFPGVGVLERTVRGDAAAALVDESRGAELVVVGSHGRGGLGGILRGSVSHSLLHHAHCPVAVVRNE
jgi:nucleotide-binding universal stress UspA family protein